MSAKSDGGDEGDHDDESGPRLRDYLLVGTGVAVFLTGIYIKVRLTSPDDSPVGALGWVAIVVLFYGFVALIYALSASLQRRTTRSRR